METKPLLAGSVFHNTLEDLLSQALQQQSISMDEMLTLGTHGWTRPIDLKPLEIHEGSIVTQGFTLENDWKPASIVFKTKHNRRKVKVVDSLITPELAIFYVDKDTRKWSYTKGCILRCDRQAFYAGEGILSQIKSFSSPQGTIHFQHDPLLDKV